MKCTSAATLSAFKYMRWSLLPIIKFIHGHIKLKLLNNVAELINSNSTSIDRVALDIMLLEKM